MNVNLQPRNIALFDIDQTLAGGVVRAHLNLYNAALGLGMTSEEIEQADNLYQMTFDVPKIKKFRANTEKEPNFQRVRTEIRTSPQVHLDFRSLPGSREGVLSLLDAGFVHGGYYTVRLQEVFEATNQWLTREGFPESKKTVICSDPKDKLARILYDWIIDPVEQTLRIREDIGNVILVDDGMEKLVGAARELVGEQPSLRKPMNRLVIIGFGLPKGRSLEGTIYADIGLRTLTLPSWQLNDVARLVDLLQNSAPI